VRPNFVDLTNQRDTVAPGQAMEFRIWAELIQQSRGRLHVFLPLLDRGLDAVIHRLTDGVYIPVQIKGRAASTVAFTATRVPRKHRGSASNPMKLDRLHGAASLR